jgi:hypothetical protein
MRVDRDRLWRHLEALCLDIGPRSSGSPGDERAVAYIAGHLRRYGAEVEVQDYRCPSWEYEPTELTLLGPGRAGEVRPAVAQTFTAGCDVEAPLAAVGRWQELDLAPGLEGTILVLYGEAAGPSGGSGQAGGEVTAPSCRSRPRESEWPPNSAIWLPSKRWIRTPV